MPSVFRNVRILVATVIFGCCTIVLTEAQNSDAVTAIECPAVSITGPIGIPNVGDIMPFVLNVKSDRETELKLRWTTNIGKVDEGQSTKQIGVRYSADMEGSTLTVNVRIEGLPAECPNLFSESIPFEVLVTAILLDAFPAPANTIPTRNLRAAVQELLRNPHDQMYIIEYFPTGTSLKTIKRKQDKVTAFMTKTLKFDGSRITFVAAEAERPLTKIYRIPPGASNPNP